MLKRYRRHFIFSNMCLIGAILLLMLIFISVYMYHDYYDSLKNTMSEVLKPLSAPTAPDSSTQNSDDASSPDSAPSPNNAPSPDNAPNSNNTPGAVGAPKSNNPAKDKKEDEPQQKEPEKSSASALSKEERRNINTVFYNKSNGNVTILSDNPIFDESIINEAVPVIVNQSESFGRLPQYHMIYYRSDSGDTVKIAVTGASYLLAPMLKLELILAGIYLITMFLFFLISWKLSLLAVRPLETAMTMEKQFVTDASHDLKTPLTVILANSSILQSSPQSTVSEQMKWIDSTAEAARNMQTMVNSLLTLSHIESAGKAPAMERVSFSDIAQKAVLQMESVAYDIETELFSEISPNVYIRANADYLLHLVSGLIENALKYEPKHGNVLVQLYSQKAHAVLTVTNANSIIAPEDLPHIFDRFYRADKTRNAASGHGLGLAITKRITEAMGGAIRVTSSEETGTTFEVRFRQR